jgi:hypothetical protein
MRIDGKARDRAEGPTPALAASLGVMFLAIGLTYMSPARALNVCVRVASYVDTMPDGTTATMWGYQVAPTCTAAQLANPASAINQAVSSPGDAITVPSTDPTLSVTLINRASANAALGEVALTVPTSFVLHGHNTTMTPVFATAAGTTCTPPAPGATAPDMAALQAFRDCRVRSFTHETAPGATAVYTYSNVKPGTYLYQSGTMPQIQVQMGLYGMVRKNVADATTTTPPNAYTNLPFDNQIALLLSEVDPVVHADVAAGTFDRSTIGYDPKYFRLHRYNPPGAACATATPATCITQPTTFTEQTLPSARAPLAIQTGQRQLLRLANAGIQSRALQLIDGHWYLIAEDGNRFPYPREQYSAHLPAAKTADIWFTPTNNGGTAAIDRQLTIFDRRMALTNNNADPSGGQLLRLNVTNGTTTPPTVDVSTCATTGTQGTGYGCTVGTSSTAPTFELNIAPAGMTIDATSGAIAWTPDNAQAWKPLVGQTASNPVQVRVTDPNGRYATGSFTVAVTNTNDAPVAASDAQSVRGGVATISIATLLANDSDPDGDALGAFTVVAAPTTGTLTNNGDGTLTYTAGTLPASGSEVRTFTYTVSDTSALPSNVATVTLTVFANSAPVAVDDVEARAFAAVGATYIDVLANDYDVDGNLNAASLAIAGAPNRGGTASVVTAGCPVATRPCISYTPPVNFRGTEAMTYRVSDSLGASSPTATARVNIQ